MQFGSINKLKLSREKIRNSLRRFVPVFVKRDSCSILRSAENVSLRGFRPLPGVQGGEQTQDRPHRLDEGRESTQTEINELKIQFGGFDTLLHSPTCGFPQ